MLFFHKYWKSITWVIVIFILSSISGNSLKSIPKINIPHFDKIVHFGLYFILVIIILFDFINTKTVKFKRLILTLIFSISYGVIMELMQEYVFVKRSADLFDFLANSAGSFFGMLSFFIFHKFAKFKICDEVQ